MTDKIRLTAPEIEALLAAAGDVDPAMWEDEPDDKRGERLYDAWLSGQEKLRRALHRARMTIQQETKTK
jgi:hypothetical protein